MQSKASTVKQYIDELPADRKQAVSAVRKVILKNLPKGFEEVMDGMIGYVVPLKIYPQGYLGQKDVPMSFAGIASQKNYMSLYLLSIYADKKLYKWFVKEYKATGKKLNMGKCCVRFRKLDDLPLDLVGKTIAKLPLKKFIESYSKVHKNYN